MPISRHQFFLKWLVPKYGPMLYSEIHDDLDSVVAAEKKAQFERRIDALGSEKPVVLKPIDNRRGQLSDA